MSTSFGDRQVRVKLRERKIVETKVVVRRRGGVQCLLGGARLPLSGADDERNLTRSNNKRPRRLSQGHSEQYGATSHQLSLQ